MLKNPTKSEFVAALKMILILIMFHAIMPIKIEYHSLPSIFSL